MKLDTDVREVLERAVVAGKRLQLQGQLDRKLYVKVAKALELMGGKWTRKEGAHLFEDDAEGVVADAVATGAVVDFKKEFQFFETPPEVARQLVELAGIKRGNSVLEPSAGKGAIAEAIRDAGFEPSVCELWATNREALKRRGFLIIEDDFLSLTVSGWDRIVANPPFSLGQDVAHVTHMWELLAPGGRLVSVMLPSWRTRQSKRHAAFRALCVAAGGKWIELPAESFKASGTNVCTGIIVLEKAPK